MDPAHAGWQDDEAEVRKRLHKWSETTSLWLTAIWESNSDEQKIHKNKEKKNAAKQSWDEFQNIPNGSLQWK